ncbi:methionyl-tRNA formyltransferase [Chloroflexota bacterium]
MRIVIFTVEEPFYLPETLGKVLEKRGSNVVGVIVSSPARFAPSLLKLAKRLWEFYGTKDFIIQSLLFLKNKILDIMPLKGFYSVKAAVAHYSVPLYRCNNINTPKFFALLSKQLKPDLIISMSFDQILRKPILELPSLGCINMHSAMLPKYRGMLPSFWVLVNGETETGITVHYMNERIDDGDIILQAKIEIMPEDTMHSLIIKGKETGAQLLLQALAQIESGVVCTLPNDSNKATYYSFPKKDEVKKFRQRGRRFR